MEKIHIIYPIKQMHILFKSGILMLFLKEKRI